MAHYGRANAVSILTETIDRSLIIRVDNGTFIEPTRSQAIVLQGRSLLRQCRMLRSQDNVLVETGRTLKEGTEQNV